MNQTIFLIIVGGHTTAVAFMCRVQAVNFIKTCNEMKDNWRKVWNAVPFSKFLLTLSQEEKNIHTKLGPSMFDFTVSFNEVHLYSHIQEITNE